MIENLLYIVTIQIGLLLLHAAASSQIHRILEYIWKGVAVGIPSGVIFDLIVGKYFGFYSYIIGFELWFLITMGATSYACMVAHIFLLQNWRLYQIVIWATVMAFVCEVANMLFPVWTWYSYELQTIPLIATLYIIGTIGTIINLQLLFNIKFRSVGLRANAT